MEEGTKPTQEALLVEVDQLGKVDGCHCRGICEVKRVVVLQREPKMWLQKGTENVHEGEKEERENRLGWREREASQQDTSRQKLNRMQQQQVYGCGDAIGDTEPRYWLRGESSLVPVLRSGVRLRAVTPYGL